MLSSVAMATMVLDISLPRRKLKVSGFKYETQLALPIYCLTHYFLYDIQRQKSRAVCLVWAPGIEKVHCIPRMSYEVTKGLEIE